MSKLWQKKRGANSAVPNELIEAFTVGRDFELDELLVRSDCVASIAHAEMLAHIGMLKKDECENIRNVLLAIIDESGAGRFHVSRADEDCHTAIENRLTRELGEAGKKIHAGRSRNDQVLAALRVFTRARLHHLMRALLSLCAALAKFAEEHQDDPMPGRTHMQLAMPSTVGLWAASFAELLLDDFELLDTAYDLNNRSPLGAAASYGVPLPLDREMVANRLAFGSVQNNVLAVNNSRGKIESIVLDSLDHVGISLSKLAQDMIIFSLPEFGYFSLPPELCTGSSIMPQKKNPDGLELLRSKSATVGGWAVQVKNVIRSLPSGYNRDFQDTKEPLLRGLDLSLQCLQVARLLIEQTEVHPDRLRVAFAPEIFATDAVYELVRGGMSFRDAYREVGGRLEALEGRSPDDAIALRTSGGTPGNLRLERLHSCVAARLRGLDSEIARVNVALEALCGKEITV